MISLPTMLVIATLGPAAPISEVEPQTASEKAGEFVMVSGAPATTIQTRAVLSLGALAFDETSSLQMRGVRWVRPRAAGKLPLRARIDGLDGGALLSLGLAKGIRYHVDCAIEAEGKLLVSLEIGETGAIDATNRYFTKKAKDGHLTLEIGRQAKALTAFVFLQSKKPWTLTRCEITPETSGDAPPAPASEKVVATTKSKRWKLAKRLIDASVVESQLLEPMQLSPRRAAVDDHSYLTYEWAWALHPDAVFFGRTKMTKDGWVELHFLAAADRDYLIDCAVNPEEKLEYIFEGETLGKKVTKVSNGHVFFAARPTGVGDVTVTLRSMHGTSWLLYQCEVTPVKRKG